MDGDQQAADQPGPEPEPGPPDQAEREVGDAAEATDAGEEKGDQEEKSSTRWAVELVGVVVVAILVAVLLRTFVVATYSIPSGSMEPTLKVGDRIVVDKLSYHLHGIGRGDIVVFTTPPNENCAGPPVADLVKRVIGLPGEIISLRDGRVYINGTLYPEPFLPPAIRNDTYPGPSSAPYSLHQPYRIPQGDVFMMGDNRPFSCDSRFWGPVPESTIVGKVDLRIWPLTRIGFF
jgi:signal peptidase I